MKEKSAVTTQQAVTRLIIVRHAETEANVSQLWQGSLDAPLTKRGRMQTAATARRIHELSGRYPVEHYYVSPLPRAQSTAAAISHELQQQPEIVNGLREFDLGDWEGRSFRELRETENLWERWAVDPTFAPPNGESPASFGERTERIFLEIAEANAGRTSLVVTHGGLICNLLARWLGAGPQEWREWEPHNCAVTVLERAESGWSPVLVNDVSHLPAEARFEEDKSVYDIANG